MEELRRQAGWAKTFGLPLELISAEQAQGLFGLMSTDGVLGAAWLPTDGYLDPSQLTFALAERARGGRRPSLHEHARDRDRRRGRSREARADRARRRRGRGRGDRGRDVLRGGRPAGGRADPGPADVARVHRHPAVSRARSGEPAADAARPRPADLLPRGRRRAGDGRLRAPTRPPSCRTSAASSRSRRTSTGACSRTTGTASSRSSTNSRRRVPEMENVTVTRMVNGPEGFTPDNEFCLGETEVAGLFVAAGFCAHGLAGAGGVGKVMAEWIAAGEPSLDLWHMDIRRFGAQYRSPSYSLKRIRETYETYYDIKYPGHEREAGRPLRMSPVNAWHREHGAAFGEKSGWERVNWYRSNEAPATRGCGRAAGPGRTGRPRSGPSTPPAGRRPRSSTRARSPSSRSQARARRSCSSGSATTASHARWGGSPTRRCSTRAAGSSATSRSRDSARSRFSIVTGTAFGNHDREWIRRHAARRWLAARPGRDLGLGLLRALGAALARRARAADPAVAGERGLPVHERCASSRSATCRCARCG